jgi:hypothetical protein
LNPFDDVTPFRSRIAPGCWRTPVGWATVRITEWQTGHRAESLAVFWMPDRGNGRGPEGKTTVLLRDKTKKPTGLVVGFRERLRRMLTDEPGSAARQVGKPPRPLTIYVFVSLSSFYAESHYLQELVSEQSLYRLVALSQRRAATVWITP